MNAGDLRYLVNAALRLERKKGRMAQRWLSVATLALITGLVLLFINSVVQCQALPREQARPPPRPPHAPARSLTVPASGQLLTSAVS